MKDYDYTATYSPEDNKLRLYALGRLPEDLYERVREAGFHWAPKQELFVAPRWTPSREDLLLELCGEIGDEDTSLVDRAEARAERFEELSEKRKADSEAAHKTASDIAENIPLGQPILVGHHSEKRARKDAERIEAGMHKAVKMWDTARYWEQRARGALDAAKYKELPRVRARRIKTLESERRKIVASYTPLITQKMNGIVPVLMQTPRYCPVCRKYSCKEHPEAETPVPHVFCGPNSRGGSWIPVAELPRMERGAQRWLAHYDNRLAYEKAMLDEQGASGLLKPPPRPKQPPLLNYRAPNGVQYENQYRKGLFETFPQVEMTKAQYNAIYPHARWVVPIGNHRVRTTSASRAPGWKEPEANSTDRYNAAHKRVCVFLTDSKEHPKPEEKPESNPEPQISEAPLVSRAYREPAPVDPKAEQMEALRHALKTGEAVQTVSAPQLFVTPREIAEQMADLADIEPGHAVLEPSAGTGALLGAIGGSMFGHDPERGSVVAVEINVHLSNRLRQAFPMSTVYDADFLECGEELGQFDRVVMNPPFANGVDIKHIRHAFNMLKPGGRLVALCADGPRQQRAFRDTADYWEPLPAGSFKESGTNVNVAMLVIDKPAV